MNLKNTAQRYGPLPIGLHWLMLLLLAAVYACIELHDLAPRGSALRAGLKTGHFMLGLGVLVLVAVRLLARWLSGPAPVITPPIPAWQARASAGVHAALYLFMLGMPLLGWLTVGAKGHPVPLFFGLELPALIAPDKGLGHRLEDIHETIGTLGYVAIGLHAAAALVHHYGRRDDTLRRMLPRGR